VETLALERRTEYDQQILGKGEAAGIHTCHDWWDPAIAHDEEGGFEIPCFCNSRAHNDEYSPRQ